MARRYRAFLSYSHVDADMARWLHTRLETYRLPRRIADIASSAEANGRLGPVFRDREELPAAEDLSEAVKKAIEASDVLVVLCSPDARKSPWVTREIELFREVAPDRPILAAIIRGEPEDAFPAALSDGREPLAADLRRDGDGRKLGFLKVVAGVANVPLDALVQRDAQRNLRRVTAVTLASAAAAVIMAAMSIVAIQSRNEAERQRAEAEGLVEYMLTDLRGELRGVGRLDVMGNVNGRAMAYYEGQGNLDGWPPESLERRARILHAMGEDETYREGGDLDEALSMFREAERTTAALRDKDPQNPDRVFGHAQSQYWIGQVYELREEYRPAQSWYKAYDDSAKRLDALDPDTFRTQMERGFGALNLGIVAFRIGDNVDEALRLFQSGIDWFERASATDPADEASREELANAWSWLSNVHYSAKNFEEALTAQQNAARIKQELATAAPLDKDRYFSVLIARRALAMNHIQLGNRAGARQDLAELAIDTARLSASDPANAVWLEFANRTKSDLKELQHD